MSAPLLLSPDDFTKKTVVLETPDADKLYKTATLIPGTVIFRGDNDKKKLPSTEVPAFFADAMSAHIYTRGDKNKLSAFRVKSQPKLFILSYMNLAALFDEDERLTAEEKQALDMYLQTEPGLPPYIVPVGFLKRENAQGEHKLYLARRIINIVCRLGYDGWIAMPDTLIQRNLDTRHAMETGEYRYILNPFNPEIALCKWDTWLDPLEPNKK